MPDLADERPERWWVLDPVGHRLLLCGACGRPLDLNSAVPMLDTTPLCAVDVGRALTDTPVTVEYAIWLETGDPRYWSAWMCNCPYCDAEEMISG